MWFVIVLIFNFGNKTTCLHGNDHFAFTVTNSNSKLNVLMIVLVLFSITNHNSQKTLNLTIAGIDYNMTCELKKKRSKETF